jgi:hypothetical protein
MAIWAGNHKACRKSRSISFASTVASFTDMARTFFSKFKVLVLGKTLTSWADKKPREYQSRNASDTLFMFQIRGCFKMADAQGALQTRLTKTPSSSNMPIV